MDRSDRTEKKKRASEEERGRRKNGEKEEEGAFIDFVQIGLSAGGLFWVGFSPDQTAR
jgi:hypothetical protein